MPKRWNTNDFKASNATIHMGDAMTDMLKQRLRDIRTTPNRVFNGPSLREMPPTNQTTETVKSRIISLEILLHAQRQTIMRQGRSTKTVPVYISAFIHQRHAVTGQMLFDPFR